MIVAQYALIETRPCSLEKLSSSLVLNGTDRHWFLCYLVILYQARKSQYLCIANTAFIHLVDTAFNFLIINYRKHFISTWHTIRLMYISINNSLCVRLHASRVSVVLRAHYGHSITWIAPRSLLMWLFTFVNIHNHRSSEIKVAFALWDYSHGKLLL